LFFTPEEQEEYDLVIPSFRLVLFPGDIVLTRRLLEEERYLYLPTPRNGHEPVGAGIFISAARLFSIMCFKSAI